MYVEHALTAMGKSLSLPVERAWLSVSRSAEVLSVKWNLTDAVQGCVPVAGKAQFAFGAKPCEYCYVHCISSIERGRRLNSSEPRLHAYSLVFVDMVGASAPPTRLIPGRPRFIMPAGAAVAISAVVSLFIGSLLGFVKYLRRKPPPALVFQMNVFVLIELFDLLVDWGQLDHGLG